MSTVRRPTYDAQQRQHVRLVCGHSPTKLRQREATGYCPRCRSWEWIDYNATEARLKKRQAALGLTEEKVMPEPDRNLEESEGNAWDDEPGWC